MYVAELDIPWEQSDFMFQGFTINSVAEIKALRRQCEHVFVHIDTRRTDRRKPTRRTIPIAHFDTLSVDKEMEEASAYSCDDRTNYL